jgi:hypothetical protein
MPEKINEIIQKDETESSKGKNTGEGFEIAKTLELEELSKDISKINEAISHDQKINLSDVENIEKTIGQIKINIDGEEMTIAEAKKIPALKENIKIWEEIRNGSIKNSKMLTLITPEIASILAEQIGAFWLNGLTTLSDEAAERLSKHKDGIFLNNLTTLSDNAAEHLSKHKGPLWLNGLTTLSDIAAEHFSNSNWLFSLNGLTSISNTAAEHLSKHPNLYTNEIIREKIDKFKK